MSSSLIYNTVRYFFLSFFLFKSRRIVDLQCYVSFWYIAKQFSFIYSVIHKYKYIYIYIYILFHILFHYGLLQDIEYSSLCYTVGPCCLSILYIVIYSSSMCFEKCKMFCIYHYSIMQNSFTALKKPCVPHVYPGVQYFF